MTDKQINALAREYAVEATKADAGDPNLSANELNDIKQTVADYAADVFRWLSDRYCIVEKSEIKEWVNTVAEVVSFPENIALKIGAERLFGKELFKDEEK